MAREVRDGSGAVMLGMVAGFAIWAEAFFVTMGDERWYPVTLLMLFVCPVVGASVASWVNGALIDGEDSKRKKPLTRRGFAAYAVTVAVLVGPMMMPGASHRVEVFMPWTLFGVIVSLGVAEVVMARDARRVRARAERRVPVVVARRGSSSMVGPAALVAAVVCVVVVAALR